MEVNNMKDFNKVAIVNLFDDYACDDYAVALYDDEAKLICDSWLVVVKTMSCLVGQFFKI